MLIKKWQTHVVLIFLWVTFTLGLSHFLHYWTRLVFILLGFIAMWSLWVAREKRGDNWTDKTKNIWLCLMLFVVSAIIGNIQLFYREQDPTFGTLLVGYVFLLTINNTFNNDQKYTNKYTGLYTKHPGA